MAAGLHIFGEEFQIRHIYKGLAKPASLTVGLYHDATDSLTETDDLSAITTEPSDGNYSRATVTFDSADLVVSKNGDGNYQAELTNDGGNDLEFDTRNTTGKVDAFFVVINFQSDEAGDSGDTDHIYMTKTLSQEYTLDGIDNLALDNLSTDHD